MVEYRIVKYCRMCKVRFVVDRTQAKLIYCSECQVKAQKEREEREENNE